MVGKLISAATLDFCRIPYMNNSDQILADEVKVFLRKFDLWDQMIDWNRDLQLQDIFIHVESNPVDGVTAIDTLYSSFPKPETGRLLKMERGMSMHEVISRILLEHYMALEMD